MDSRHLTVELTPPLATVTLDRPARRNALSLDLMRDLTASLRDVGANEEIAVIILAAEGPAFCAGHDLTEMLGGDRAGYRLVFDVCTDLMTEIQRVPQPVVAQVDGVATAAGCQLAASCDLVIASDRAQFATPGVRIGLFCSTPMVPLTRAIGRKRALEMLLTGDPIDAATACEWGLVNRVVPSEQLAEAVRQLACRIAEASPLVVRTGKEAFYSQIDLNQPRAYSYVKQVMVTNALASDAQEGMSAFLEKRRPAWKGR